MKVSKFRLMTIAVGAFLMMLCSGIVNNSTTYFVIPVSEYLNCSTSQFSLYYTIITICSAIMSLIVGSIVKKIGMRISAIIACVGVGSGFFLLTNIRALWMVYAAAILIGTFQSFIVVPTVSVINSWFTEGSGSVTGIAMSATGFGGLLLGMIMPSVMASGDFRRGYLVYLGLWVGLSLIVCLLVGGRPPQQEAPVEKASAAQTKASAPTVSKPQTAAPQRSILTMPSFWLLMFSAVCSAGTSMISQHMSNLLTMNGMDVAMISFIIGIMSLGLAVCKIAEGTLADRIPLGIFVPLLHFLGAIGYLAFTGHGSAMMIVGVLGYAVSAPMCTVMYPLIMRRLYGPEQTAQYWGIAWSAFMLGHAIWTPLYAGIYDATGKYTLGVLSTSVIFVIFGIYFAVILRQKESNK